jgi:hypothetical protein
MTTMDDINAKAEAVRAKIEERLRVKARDLPRAMAKAGRRLPRKLQAQAQVIVDAQSLGGHPKLTRMVDMAAIERVHDVIVAQLDQIDPADVRRGALLALLGDIAFKLLFVIAAFIVWLWWSGTI